jgi:hypothetical protein
MAYVSIKPTRAMTQALPIMLSTPVSESEGRRKAGIPAGTSPTSGTPYEPISSTILNGIINGENSQCAGTTMSTDFRVKEIWRKEGNVWESVSVPEDFKNFED